MRSSYLSALAVFAGCIVAPACYAERQPPPTFRYACEQTSDCRASESCVDGICITPCTLETFSEVCTNGELACLNGACVSACALDDNTCPVAHECRDIGIEAQGGGGFFGGGGDTPVGVCLRPCTPSSCGGNEACLDGLCVTLCSLDEECQSGLSCQAGLCLPELSGSTSSETPTSESTGNTTESGGAT